MSALLPAWKPYGLALKAYEEGKKDITLSVNTEDGTSTEMEVGLFFRAEDEFPEIEQIALSLCKGRILDIGAGAGAHALVLQNNGFEVCALDPSAEAVEVMDSRGIKKTVTTDFLSFESDQKFDTLLFLMNGIGIAGKQAALRDFLLQAKKLCNGGGQILLDSSDPDYFDENQKNIVEEGEVLYQLAFEEKLGAKYSWLYLGFEPLREIANKVGLEAMLIKHEDDGSYLAQLKVP